MNIFRSLYNQFKNPLGYAAMGVWVVLILLFIHLHTGIFSPATVCGPTQITCSPVESMEYATSDLGSASGFTLESFASLFERQAESVLTETKNNPKTASFESQFRPYIYSKQSTYAGQHSILPYAQDYLAKGTITPKEEELLILSLDNALTVELKNFLAKNEQALIQTYERQYEKKVPLVFDPAASIRLFEQLQNTYSGNGQLFVVENMSRAGEIEEGETYDYVDWTATIRTSLPYLTRFIEDIEDAQSLKEVNNARLELPFFIIKQGKINFLDTAVSGSGSVMTDDLQRELRTDLVLRMYLAKVDITQVYTLRNTVQEMINTEKEYVESGKLIAPSMISKYDQLKILSNERVRLYREALRAKNLRIAYNELTTLEEIYTELLTYFP